MRNIILLFCFVVFYSFSASAKEDSYDRIVRTKTIRCGYLLYPPYLDKDLNTGALNGPAYDVAQKVGETLGFNLEWVEEIAVGNEVAVLEAGRVDAICGTNGTYDPNAFSRVSFSKAWAFVNNSIFARANDSRFSSNVGLDDLNKPEISFVGIDGDSTSIYPRLLFPKASIKDLGQLNDTSLLFQELLAQKADLVLIEIPVGFRASKNNGSKFKIISFTGDLPEYGARWVFAKGSYKLQDTVNTTLEYMNVNGVLNKILDKYDSDRIQFRRVSKPYDLDR